MNLTLPPIPNFDIPASPPGSPDPAAAGKLTQFTQLKQQGVHFNERLASSTSIKNPNLFAKLLDSFGISAEDQYATTLPASLWDPSSFPQWSYKEELAKAQIEAQKQLESQAAASGHVEFVPASEKQNRANRDRR
jgi:HCNGP-like protein